MLFSDPLLAADHIDKQLQEQKQLLKTTCTENTAEKRRKWISAKTRTCASELYTERQQVEKTFIADMAQKIRKTAFKKDKNNLVTGVVHIQSTELRRYYMLDRLWNDCPKIELDIVKEEAARG